MIVVTQLFSVTWYWSAALLLVAVTRHVTVGENVSGEITFLGHGAASSERGNDIISLHYMKIV